MGILLNDGKKKERKVTYTAQELIICPLCDCKFHRENLFQGRVNAGELTDELHRLYIPTKAFGEVYPLIYSITVCPSCFFAAFKNDFTHPPELILDALRKTSSQRIERVQNIFSSFDFDEPRGLMEGAASYFLAMLSYDKFPEQYSPTIKIGICSLRMAWLCLDLHLKFPQENYDYLAAILYRKARILYKAAIELEMSGKEPVSSVPTLGPDTDKNYGYEGTLYMAAVLEYKYGPKKDPEKRKQYMEIHRMSIAKIFGFGKKTKEKPGPLLETARGLYDKISAELKVNDTE